MKHLKQRKVRCFYTDTTREKPEKTCLRHFIHSKASGGFWAYIRDLSQSERAGNDAVGHKAAVSVEVGYNRKILELWDHLTVLDEKGMSYRVAEKPDEYEYTGGDIRFVALSFHDKTVYGGDVYEQ